jgi:hypothetical protein
MSGADAPQGTGWWQASDGKWYAPEQASASPPPVPPAPGQPTPPAGDTGQTGFLGRLFDVSMKSFITPSIVKVLFVLGIIVISLGALALLLAGTQGDGAGFLIVLAPLYWFVGVLYLRVILEVIVVLFRIEENTRHTR